MDALVRWIERITGSAGLLIAWVVLPLILASCYEVFSRYVLDAPTIWAFELGYMAMGIHSLIGAAFALRDRAHIRIDILYIHFPPRVRALLDVAGYLLLFMPVVCWVSLGLWDYWIEAFVSGEHSGQSAWNPLIWPFRLTFFIGFFLLALQGLAELIKCAQFLAGRRAVWE
ncbi:MAG: TRAP transporter small permease subunit [Rhodospirillaceae bacterium]|jgi:TRAP-type mannitol/chloroaromatic compound transport system permease small subunit